MIVGEEDVDSILEKYKKLGKDGNAESETHKGLEEEDDMDGNGGGGDDGGGDGGGGELDENEAGSKLASIENEEKVQTQTREVDDECVEDTSDYLTEPEDNFEEQDGSNVENSEEPETVDRKRKTQEVTKSDGFQIMKIPRKKRKVKCNQCDWTGGQTGLNYHRKSKHLGVRFQCPHCEFRSPRTEYLAGHIMTKHRQDAPRKGTAKETGFKCSRCSWVVGTGNGLRYHTRTVHEGLKSGKYKCNCCEFKSTSKSNMESHMIVEHKDAASQKSKIEAHDGIGSKAIESQQDLPSKIKSEADISKDSNVDCEDEEDDDLLPPFWHPADGHGLVFKPGEGKERCFPSYQQAVRWLIQTGDSIKDHGLTEWIEGSES